FDTALYCAGDTRALSTSLADLYCAFGMMILRCCYHQILGPGRHFPKFANGCYRHSDIWVRLDPHLTWQATKSYVERGDAFGLILHHGSLTARSGSFVRLRSQRPYRKAG